MSKKDAEIKMIPLPMVARAINLTNSLHIYLKAGDPSLSTRLYDKELLLTWHKGDKSLIVGISDLFGDSLRIKGDGLSRQMRERVRLHESQSRLDWFIQP